MLSFLASNAVLDQSKFCTNVMESKTGTFGRELPRIGVFTGFGQGTKSCWISQQSFDKPNHNHAF